MKISLYMDDLETERMFSYLRWLFLLLSICLFYSPSLAVLFGFQRETYPFLFGIGIVYMTAAQIALCKKNFKLHYFPFVAKAGILFDYIAVIWLLAISGGTGSPLFPLSFLVIMHSTIYWRTKGAILSSAAFTVGMASLFMTSDLSIEKFSGLMLELLFIWTVGVLGSMIVIRERQHNYQKLLYKQQLSTDYLTGLYNHRHFQEELRSAFSENSGFVLIFGDIDHFKFINDRYGHMVGDEVLKGIGEIFKGVASDYGGQAFRYGGEEFAFMLPQTNDAVIGQFFVDLYGRLSRKVFTQDFQTITMSFGAAWSRQTEHPDDILRKADELLYAAKSSGKNRACFEDGFVYCNGNYSQSLSDANHL
ncbi:GGDEF domain-containing protein [Bacillus massilinigeriensis]|uniref:GGDEF domain-containing protein n=1 Tax=Bacillus mediterraneensis TaxID=1805474 RepID=UPI0008F919E4|nr:GGDEF domain-containing protein [Bacillus mediterraneensis]